MSKNSIKALINKVVAFLIVFLGVVTFSVEIFGSGTMTIPNPNGGVINHYGSTDPVYINVDYDLKNTEFRACWVSPLVTDIPYFTSEDQYKKVIIEVLDNMEAYKLNVMLFHIRIMNDAFYKSEYNNYSIYYNANPTWEALPWIIEECHRRGIEFHAWMNPYRVTNNPAKSLEEMAASFPSGNVGKNVDYLLKGKNSIILNPGEPEVRSWLLKVCMEVVENYDVDAIHFDDYFYDDGIDDTITRAKYNTTGLEIGDWRRAQVDDFIERLSDRIRAFNTENNRRVQLGISPSGVYRAGNGVVTYDANGNAITNGSLTASDSFQHYDKYLYSDTLKWINNEWIDYIIPQTYWGLNHPKCPYTDLMIWWDAVVKYKNVRVYSGLGLYLSESSGGYSWYQSKDEAYYQIMVSNGLDNIDGVAFFKYSNIAAAVKDPSLTRGVNTIWTTPMILPEIKTMDIIPIDSVTNLGISKNSAGYKLSFDKKEEAKFYVIYRSTSPITYSSSEVHKIIGDISLDGVVNYTDTTAKSDTVYYYGVKAQSYSNTLGAGKTVNTIAAQEGSLTNLGEIEELTMSDPIQVGKTVSVIFKPFYYSYGGAVSYKLEYAFNGGSTTTVTTFSLRRGYYYVDVNAPVGVDTLNVTLTITNSIGSTSRTEQFNVYEGLPSITNFGVIGDLYTYKEATFVWNNLLIPDAEYVIQRSLDALVWEDVETISSNVMTFNVVKEITLSALTGNIYYRVIIRKDSNIGYSNVMRYTINDYLGDYQNLTINGADPISIYQMKEGDNLIIRWKRHSSSVDDVQYITYVSSDCRNWLALATYSKTASLVSESDGYMVLTIPLNYSKPKLYIQITASADTKKTQTNIFEFYVGVKYLYTDEVSKYFYDDIISNTRELDVFSGY